MKLSRILLYLFFPAFLFFVVLPMRQAGSDFAVAQGVDAGTDASVDVPTDVATDGSSDVPSETSVAAPVNLSDDTVSFPYSKTFTITAYYSPLPCQNRYLRGNFEAEKKLNCRGTNGADGTEVYPGMIAAPRSYDYGMKLYIPGFGIGAIHDRGGAIVANSDNGRHDRLDIWMGWGDAGLKRALSWGKRDVLVTVFGDDDSVVESVYLDGFSYDEKRPNECTYQPSSPAIEEPAPPSGNGSVIFSSASTDPFLNFDLSPGSSGHAVSQLQQELMRLNFFKENITGYYGPVTEHAVYKFQQSQYLVGDVSSLGAGVFGPKTRKKLNSFVAARDYSTGLVAAASGVAKPEDASENTRRLFAMEMDFGLVDFNVKLLQELLKKNGYFDGILTTNYFGPSTKNAVLNFQLSNGIIKSADDVGAGRVGPATLDAINKMA